MRLESKGVDLNALTDSSTLKRWSSVPPWSLTDYSTLGQSPRHIESPFPFDPRLNGKICLW